MTYIIQLIQLLSYTMIINILQTWYKRIIAYIYIRTQQLRKCIHLEVIIIKLKQLKVMQINNIHMQNYYSNFQK